MLLFVNPSNSEYVSKIVIPMSRVYNIVACGCAVNVNYDSGELVEIEGKFEKKIETVRVVFDSADDVDKIFRQFYKASREGANVFFIGKTENCEKKN